MNLKKLLVLILVLVIALFAFSGCTVVLLTLGANYLFGEPIEPTAPTVPDITDPQPTKFNSNPNIFANKAPSDEGRFPR